MSGGYLTEYGFVVDKKQVSKPQELSLDSPCGRAFANSQETEVKVVPPQDETVIQTNQEVSI